MILVPPLCNQPHNPHDDNCKKHNNDSYDFLTPPFVLSRELIMMIADLLYPVGRGKLSQPPPNTPMALTRSSLSSLSENLNPWLQSCHDPPYH